MLVVFSWFVIVLQGFVGYCCCGLILNSVVHAKLLRLVCFLADGWFSSFVYLLDFCLGLVGLAAVGLHCDVASVVGLACCGFWLTEWLVVFVCCFAWCIMAGWCVVCGVGLLGWFVVVIGVVLGVG